MNTGKSTFMKSFVQIALGVSVVALAQLGLYSVLERRVLQIAAEKPTSYLDPCGRKKPSTPVFNTERFRRCTDFYIYKLGTCTTCGVDDNGNLRDDGRTFTVSSWRAHCVAQATGGFEGDPEVLNDALACAENVYSGAELQKAVESVNWKRREKRK